MIRYSLINSTLGPCADAAAAVTPGLKKIFGKKAYDMQNINQIVIKKSVGVFDVELNDGEFQLKDVNTQVFVSMNSRFGGGGMVISPKSFINDGFFEVMYFNKVLTPSEFGEVQKKSRECAGDNQYTELYKVKKAKCVNKQKATTSHNFVVDGEVMHYQEFITQQIVPGGLELICDFGHILNTRYFKK